MSNSHFPQILVLLLGLLIPHSPLPAYDSIVLTTENDSNQPTIQGNKSLLDHAVTPASTFKMVLCWAGLETGLVTPSSKSLVTDQYVPGTPRKLALTEAMFYSSNDYFVQLAKRWPESELNAWVNRSHFFATPLPSNWLSKGFSSLTHTATTTAQQEHKFILRVMRHQLTQRTEIDRQLWECLAWPSSGSTWKVYGKTGSATDVFWFNGFGISKDHQRAVTVLFTGKDASRNLAIAEFYRQFDLSAPNQP